MVSGTPTKTTFMWCRLTLQTNMSLFYMVCSHLHTFRKTSHKVNHPKMIQLKYTYLWSFYGLSYQKEYLFY